MRIQSILRAARPEIEEVVSRMMYRLSYQPHSQLAAQLTIENITDAQEVAEIQARFDLLMPIVNRVLAKSTKVPENTGSKECIINGSDIRQILSEVEDLKTREAVVSHLMTHYDFTTLDLGGLGITQLPDPHHDSLMQTVILNGNDLKELPPAFFKLLDHIKEVDLRNNPNLRVTQPFLDFFAKRTNVTLLADPHILEAVEEARKRLLVEGKESSQPQKRARAGDFDITQINIIEEPSTSRISSTDSSGNQNSQNKVRDPNSQDPSQGRG